MIVSLMQWGDRWLAKAGKPPILLVSEKSGRPVEKLEVREKGGRPLSFQDVCFAPGPGATSVTKVVIANRNERVLGHD